MSDIAAIPLPTWGGDRDATLALVDGWLTSDPLRDLVAAFGGTERDDLVAFARRTWDFRGGAERNLVARRTFSPELDHLATRATTALGLRAAVPPSLHSYDAVLVLGGLLRGCVVRPRAAARLLAEGLEASEVTALGSHRPLSEPERGLGARLGVAAASEVEALETGMRRAFADRGLDIPFRVIAAPPAPGAARADTRATYRYWAEQLRAADARSVLLITHPIYVPYQGAVAIGTLGIEHGLRVETIGVTDEDADLGPDTGTFSTQAYLQETLSAISALTELRARLVAPPPSA